MLTVHESMHSCNLVVISDLSTVRSLQGGTSICLLLQHSLRSLMPSNIPRKIYFSCMLCQEDLYVWQYVCYIINTFNKHQVFLVKFEYTCSIYLSSYLLMVDLVIPPCLYWVHHQLLCIPKYSCVKCEAIYQSATVWLKLGFPTERFSQEHQQIYYRMDHGVAMTQSKSRPGLIILWWDLLRGLCQID